MVRDTSRFALFISLLGLTGDVETLVDLAGDELFHEMGLSLDFAIVLEDAASRSELSPALRFWALDALAFTELKKGDFSKLQGRLNTMAHLVTENTLGRREILTLGMKRMLFAAKRGDEMSASRELGELRQLVSDDPARLRILKYNAACAMFLVGQTAAAKVWAQELIKEYFDYLGLDLADVLAKNPNDIWPLLEKTDSIHDDLKHLADSLDLLAKCASARGEDSGFARLHAFKFYAMAYATASALKVGQDLVDEFLRREDPIGARQVLERYLLPTALQAKMVDWIVPLRSQYAVVLAHCGDFAAADAEMTRLTPYEAGLAELGKSELRNQRVLIGKLRAVRERGRRPESNLSPPRLKTGRNEPCPCGSGKKYKRCHGGHR